MAEGTYEYECMRAELLGIEKPDYESFMKEKKTREEAENVEEDEIDTENLKEAETQNAQLKNASGGLEELNNILSITQKKIDRFKVRCNSITSLLKIKVGGLSSGETNEDTTKQQEEKQREGVDDDGGEEAENNVKTEEGEASGNSKSQKKKDFNKVLDNHVNKLDAMLDSADNAYHSMSHQNKQMKKFLK